ncbi:2-oxoacid:ferredoxin oxidoreductase subunit beta [Parabacteroides sp. 52]|uniref:2-oxoacid:ferredoxin oxidoreductase subunit beta n=1 Tax=unclassified Parabacteroides TaxID=2649774 RepID=UPI0013D73FB6|nr:MULTISPECIES: 2-oxoacid:ferredoxin oxidoreductase subunit beta [unclassified Parabacteroides]MDH6535196.1 2-oxoglutarate ferredoxin oxidoreductase subunit beta [Parabacteroides sp. PM5-20]NDV56316.1 2-oxoacid:ferredoxin oxidoreductase subunit beta [Parabacteroides sp. 52]
MENELKYQAKDYKSDQYVRWCPGCGDHAVLNCMHKAMAELGVCPKDIAVISGIGCSSRLPYYMNSYGFHTIHGRAAAIATGVKTARPDLSVWVMTGDGDCLAIGGNHFIHAVRRNVDLNVVLFNNKIYGLTKGQYSPTSDKGAVTKSSPYGSVEEPFIPAELTLGARGNFFARLIDVDLKNTTAVLTEAARHKGTSVVEVLVNCVIFNDGIHKQITDKEHRADRTIFLRHGEKMLFGKENEKGLVLDGLKLKVVTIGQDGYTLDDILVHDAHEKDLTLHMMLGLMGGDMPVALGVIRDVEAPVYDQEVEKQIAEVQAKNPTRTLRELLMQGEVWEVKEGNSK